MTEKTTNPESTTIDSTQLYHTVLRMRLTQSVALLDLAESSLAEAKDLQRNVIGYARGGDRAELLTGDINDVSEDTMALGKAVFACTLSELCAKSDLNMASAAVNSTISALGKTAPGTQDSALPTVGSVVEHLLFVANVVASEADMPDIADSILELGKKVGGDERGNIVHPRIKKNNKDESEPSITDLITRLMEGGTVNVKKVDLDDDAELDEILREMFGVTVDDDDVDAEKGAEKNAAADQSSGDSAPSDEPLSSTPAGTND